MLDFSKPMEMELTGEPVRYICSDVVEIGYARVCVDSDTGIIYSGPHIGRRVIQSTASGLTPLQADAATEAPMPARSEWYFALVGKDARARRHSLTAAAECYARRFCADLPAPLRIDRCGESVIVVYPPPSVAAVVEPEPQEARQPALF